MKRLVLLLAVAVCVVGWSGVAQATEYHVGSGQQYATMNALLAAVTLGDNDIAWVHPGTYASFAVSSGGGSSEATAAQIRAWDINNRPVFSGSTNTIQISSLGKWYKLYGIEQTSATTRGIFHTCGGLIIQNCKVQNTPDGIMSGMCNTRDDNPGYLIAEYNELTGNGSGTQYHSWYLQEYWCKIRYNWTHNAVGGIGYKDRSRTSTVEYNLIEPGTGGAGCAVSFCGWDDPEMPDVGQTATLVGNIITKNGGGNRWLFINNIRMADGGVSGHNSPGYLYLYNNSFYTEDHSGPMLADDEVSIIVAHNNIFHSTTCANMYDQVDGASGPGQVLTSYNNWVKTGITTPTAFTNTVTGTAPGWVNGATSGGDFHLISGSQCRDTGRNSVAVLPTKEYAHPCGYTIRPADSTLDIGAYEYAVGGSLPPVARFEGNPTSGNMPLAVAFTDLTANSPTSWSWTFGDSGTSTAQHPTHTYTNPGEYTVALTATNSLGSDTRTQPGYIRVIDPNAPIANFDVNTRFGAVPLAVSFTDTSTNSPTAWSWAFGDGGTSAAQNPNHTYSSIGMYTVSLTVTNSYGSDVETKTDYIAACTEVVCYPTSWGNSIWGPENVTILSGGLSDLQSDNNVYMDVQCDTADQKYTMIYETLCGYTASQIFGMKYEYQAHQSRADTPNGTLMHIRTAAQEYELLDPDGVLWITTDQWWTWETTNPQHWVEDDGTIGMGVCGCPATGNTNNYSIRSDVLRFRLYLKPGQVPAPPVANFAGSPTSGAAPLAVSFTDTSTNSPTSWSWTFGDSGTSTAQNPSHTYNSAGNYTVSLTAANATGSDGETKTNYISVSGGAPPVANFTGNPTSGPAPLAVAFTDTSTNTPTSWSWNFGDSSTSTLQNPSHTYAVGTFTVTLTATNASGSDGETKTNYITATQPAPVANFTGSPTSGTAPLAVSFADTSTNTPTSWSWNFGDSSTSTAQNPSHTYAVGTFTVTLTATNAGGSDGETKTNYIAVQASGAPTFVAAGAVASGTGAITPALPAGIATNDILLLFLETANQAISISNQNGGTWAAVASSPQGTGTAGGTAATRLTAFWSRYNGTQGAPTTSDSGDHQLGRIIALRGAATSGNPWDVTAGGVESTSDTSGSIPGATTTVANTLVVAAIATSLPDASGTANLSAWANANLTSVTERTDNTVTAGNGGGLGIATGGKATAGAYGSTAVTCATAATKGMMSSALKPAAPPAPPVANFTGSPTSGAAPLAVSFTDTSTNSPSSWSWTFGDSNTSTVQNPSHTYAAGTYTVTLTATNAAGSDGETKTNYITATSGGGTVTIYSDNFNNGVTGWTTEPDARSCYCSSPSNYLINLRSGGAMWRTISTVGYSSIQVTYLLGVTSLEAGEKQEVLWYNGSTWTVIDTIADGDPDEDGVRRIYQFTLPAGANNNANFAIKFDQTADLWDDNSFLDDLVIEGTSGTPPPVANFTGTPTTGTAPLTVGFTDTSTGSPTAWSWGFGDSGTSTAQHPSHQYASAGNYTVSLTATNAGGSDGETKTNYITVTVAPPVANFTGNPTSGTVPLTVAFTDTSTGSPTSWSWNFGDSGTSTVQSPSHQYTSTGSYTVSLTATNAGGSDGETKTNYISVTSGGGQVTIYSDNFDGGLTGWSTQPSARSCYCSSPANNLINIRQDGAIWRTISTAGYTSIVVTVDLRVTGLEAGEYLQVQWYDGSTWAVADTIASGDPDADGQWHNYTYNLPSGANNNANFAVKFWISCDLWDDNGYIDNLVVKGNN